MLVSGNALQDRDWDMTCPTLPASARAFFERLRDSTGLGRF